MDEISKEIKIEKIEFRCSNMNTFIVHLIIVTITYGMFLKMHFSVDSYSLIYDRSGKCFLIAARIFTYIINLLFYKFNINITLDQQIFSAYFMICIALASTILSDIICKCVIKVNFIKWVTINIAIMLSFINVFFLEWFLYPESTFFFGTSMLCTVISVYAITQNNRLINIIISFLFLMFAMGMYQANLATFITYSFTICLIKNRMVLSRESLKNLFSILIIGFLNSILTIFFIKLIDMLGWADKSERAPSLNFYVIKNNIKGILSAQKAIWNNAYNFLPRYSVIIFGIILFSMIIYLFIKNKSCIKNIVYVGIIILINYLVIFAPHLFTSSLWLAQRTIVGFFIFISSLIILVVFYCKDDEKVIKTLSIVSGIFLIINCIQIQNIGVNHFISNKLDKEYAMMINEEIEKYENKNNVEIKYIAAESDINPTYYYRNIEYSIYDTNIRAFITPWANVNMINYFSGRTYIKVPMDSTIYEEHFKDKNWDSFSKDEQFIFLGDTLYLILY